MKGSSLPELDEIRIDPGRNHLGGNIRACSAKAAAFTVDS